VERVRVWRRLRERPVPRVVVIAVGVAFGLALGRLLDHLAGHDHTLLDALSWVASEMVVLYLAWDVARAISGGWRRGR
jgi:hypothetical protein